MGQQNFTDALSAGVLIRAIHITELRTALDAARVNLGMSQIGYADPSLAAGTAVRASHVQQLRIGVK